MTYKKIIVAVDSDESNIHICEKAIFLAQGNDASITLLHIVEPIVELPLVGGMGMVAIPPETNVQDTQKAIDDMQCRLNELKNKFSDQEIATKVIESALTRETIHEFAEETGADLIVVGSHGRHGLSLFFSGSTASELLKHTPCDILAIRIEVD